MNLGHNFVQNNSGFGRTSSSLCAKLQRDLLLQYPARKNEHIFVLWNMFFCTAAGIPSSSGGTGGAGGSAVAAAAGSTGGGGATDCSANPKSGRWWPSPAP